ncbi:MAG: glycosyltransferase [Alphaproteobacteria bacterium]|nr:glycosyltransferase [Alphaproteobacteria bacterium]
MKILIVGKKQQMHWPENVNKYLSKHADTKLFFYNKWHGLSASLLGHKRHAKCLSKTIQKFQPDIIFYVSFMFIPLEYYQILKDFPKLKRIGWAGDNFGFKDPKPNFLDLCFVFDTYCFKMLKKKRCKGIYLPLCADEHIFQYAPFSIKTKPIFVGAANPERVALLAELKTPVVIYGNNWPVHQLKQHEVHNTKISHEQISKLYQKYLPFNITYSKNVKNGLNFRIFEIGTTGNPIIVNHSQDLSLCYDPDEVISYQNAKELDAIFEDILSNPEKYKIIAQKGYIKTMQCHTFEKRLEQMLKIIHQELHI